MSRRNQKRKQNKLDVVNQAIDDKTKKVKVSKDIATREMSMDFFSSIMDSLPNPDPVLEKLGRTIEVYEDLLYDSRVQATTTSRKSAVLALEWEVTGQESQFYTDLFTSYNIEDTISEMYDGILLGYKPMEIRWATVDNKIIPLNLIGKPSRWFNYDNENRLRFLTNTNMMEGELVDPKKFIVVRRNPTYDNPYGKAILSSCYWPVVFRKNGFKFWTIFVEKYGMPFLVATAESGATVERMCDVADMLNDMVQDAIAVVPDNYNLEIKEAAEGKGKSDSLHKVYIDMANLEIAMSIVGTNLTTEVQGGSQAAATTHMIVREDIVESDRKLIEGAFNELIKRTHALNFSSEAPEFRMFAEEEIDKTLAERDKILYDSGVRFTEEYYKKKYNLEDEDFTLAGENDDNDNNNTGNTEDSED